MANRILTGVVVVLALHALLKCLFFFVISYKQRRKALDRAYAGRAYATAAPDAVMLFISIALAAALFARSRDAITLLGAFWIGGTLTQLFFHRFHRNPDATRAAPQPVSPIKSMSYAIRDRPRAAWREVVVNGLYVITGLVIWLRSQG